MEILEDIDLEKWKGGENVFFFSFLSLSRKIKVSKVELNLNVDRQKEIFQSVVKKEKRRVYHESRNPLCGLEV